MRVITEILRMMTFFQKSCRFIKEQETFILRFSAELLGPIMGILVGESLYNPDVTPFMILGIGVINFILGTSPKWLFYDLNDDDVVDLRNYGGRVFSVGNIRIAAGAVRDMGISLLIYGIGDLVLKGLSDLYGILAFLFFVIRAYRQLIKDKTSQNFLIMWTFIIGLCWFITVWITGLWLLYFPKEAVFSVQFLTGALAGLLQWIILRINFKGMGWWIAATSIGWGLGWSYIGFVAAPLSVSALLYPSVNTLLAMIRTFPSPYDLAVAGLLIGSTQWVVLRYKKVRAGWWIVASTGSWLLLALLNEIQFILSPSIENTNELFNWTFSGLVIGAITGIVFIALNDVDKTSKVDTIENFV